MTAAIQRVCAQQIGPPRGLMHDGLAARPGAEKLPPPRDRNTEQESDEQAGKRRFTRDRRDRREGSAGLARFLDRRGQTVDCCVQTSSDFTDRAGDIGCRVDGALGHAGLGRGLRYLRAQMRDLQA